MAPQSVPLTASGARCSSSVLGSLASELPAELQAHTTIPRFLHGCWVSTLRTSRLHSKGLGNQAISPAPGFGYKDGVSCNPGWLWLFTSSYWNCSCEPHSWLCFYFLLKGTAVPSSTAAVLFYSTHSTQGPDVSSVPVSSQSP